MNLTTISTLLVLFGITWGLIAASMWPVVVFFLLAAINEALVLVFSGERDE